MLRELGKLGDTSEKSGYRGETLGYLTGKTCNFKPGEREGFLDFLDLGLAFP